MLDYATSCDLSALKKNKSTATTIATPKGNVKCVLTNLGANKYQLEVPPAKAGVVGTWLRDLSDGYMSFNLNGEKDFSAKRMPGPFVVADVKKKNVVLSTDAPLPARRDKAVGVDKPWFIGINSQVERSDALPPFVWNESEGESQERQR